MPKRISSLAEKCEVCVFSIPRGLNDAFELAVDWDNPPSIAVSQKHKVIREFMKDFIDKKSKEKKIDFYNKALEFFTSKGEILNHNEKREKIKKFKSSFFILFIFSLLLPIVYANGITLSASSFTVNKTIGTSPIANLIITNTESHDFVNITLDGNPYVFMDQIPILHSGESKNITITVNSNSTINTNFKIYGFFYRDIGQPFNNYSISVTSPGYPYLDPCNLVIIKGDTVRWENDLLYDPISMSTSDSVVIDGTTITPGQSYQRQFNYIETLNYYWLRYSVALTPLCSITVTDSIGYVRDPNLDANINFDIKTNAQPTSISMSINPTYYQASILQSQEGTLIVTNTGGLTAYGIHLSGDWVTFSTNDFSLEPQQSKGVIFTVLPFVLNTSDTNQTYQKYIYANGNFNTANVNMSVFVSYTRLDSGENLTDADYLINIFCPKYPHSSLCERDPQIEYRYIYNLTGQSVNVTITQKKLDDMWSYLFSLGDEIKTYRNYDKLNFDTVGVSVNTTLNDISTLKDKVSTMEIDRQNSTTYILYFLTIAFIIFSAMITGVLIYMYKHKKQLESLRRWN